MTTRERFIKVLTGQEADRVPFMKVFGGTNAIVPKWKEPYPNIGLYIDELLKFEGRYRGWAITPVNYGLCGLPEDRVVKEEGKETVIRRGDGALVVSQEGDFHRHVLEYPVKGRSEWEIIKANYLDPDDSRRVPEDWGNYTELYAQRDYPLQLTCKGVYGFVRSMMGDEGLMYAFYDEPDLVKDIIGTYNDMCTRLWERLTNDVQFDLLECWEDMAFNGGPMVSPGIFKEFFAPAFKRIREFADWHHIPIVLVDSDGYVEELAKWLADSGVNALYPVEVQAGNKVERMLDENRSMGFIGGIDKNSMAKGKKAMDEELEKVQYLIRKGRYIPGPDHFVLSDVPFENYRYFMESLYKIILKTKPGVQG